MKKQKLQNIENWQTAKIVRKPGQSVMLTLAPEIDRNTPVGLLMGHGIRVQFLDHHNDQENHPGEVVLQLESDQGFRIVRSELLKRPENLSGDISDIFFDEQALENELAELTDLEQLNLLREKQLELQTRQEYFKVEGAKHMAMGSKFKDHPLNDQYMVYLEERNEMKVAIQYINSLIQSRLDAIKLKLANISELDQGLFNAALCDLIEKHLPKEKADKLIEQAKELSKNGEDTLNPRKVKRVG